MDELDVMRIAAQSVVEAVAMASTMMKSFDDELFEIMQDQAEPAGSESLTVLDQFSMAGQLEAHRSSVKSHDRVGWLQLTLRSLMNGLGKRLTELRTGHAETTKRLLSAAHVWLRQQ